MQQSPVKSEGKRRVYQADPTRDAAQLRGIFWEYLQWANARINETYGINFDVQSLVDEDMLTLDKFMPPKGRALLSDGNGEPSGMACLRDIGDGIGEIKRMYVRPAYRRQGIASSLLNRLLDEACQIGYRCIRLDSARFMSEAHRLYRASGFQDIAPYVGSEIPPEFQANWIFMEKVLAE